MYCTEKNKYTIQSSLISLIAIQCFKKKKKTFWLSFTDLMKTSFTNFGNFA